MPPAVPPAVPPAGPPPAGAPAGDVRAGLLRRRLAAGQAGPAEAVVLMDALARETAALLGRYDRDTLTTWRELAWYRDEAGDPAGALQLLAQLTPDLVQALGPGDPDTLQARYELAVLVGTTGNAPAAVQQLSSLLPELAAVLGPYDQRVLKAQHDLALQIADTGDVAGALACLQHLVPLVQQVLGEGHPLLDEARLDLGRYSELWGTSPAGRGAGLGWPEVVALVHRFQVWDFATDKEADACLKYLERRTGRRDLMDRIFLAPECLTAEQVAAAAFGRAGWAGPGL
ncbi:hypothetical protein [Kitasatospora sp. NPDC057223]|uniref:hypothetical protein n=1 Tax=Kitasatospora sp. NPDC057223 TaxID=3346055 RepID=UPI00362F9948